MSSTTIIAAPGLLDRRWEVVGTVTVAGVQPVLAGSTAALTFGSDGMLGVNDGCNSGAGRFTVTGDGIVFVGIGSTAMGCLDERVNAVASSIHLVLRSSVTWSIDGDLLTLTPTNVSDSGLTLRDSGSAPPPTDPPPTTEPPVTVPVTVPESGSGVLQTLLNSGWIAESYITVGGLQPVVAGDGAGFTFSGRDQILIDLGCNTGSASVTFEGDDQFTVGPVSRTLVVGCSDDVIEIETRLLGLLEHPQFWSITGDVLTIYPTNVSDTGMKLRSASTTATTTVLAPSTTDAEKISEATANRLGVLTAVAAARVNKDNSFGGQSTFQSLAVLDTIGQPTADAGIIFTSESERLSQPERDAIEATLAPISVQWIADEESVAAEIMGGSSQFDAILRLAVPAIFGDEATMVSGLYCGGLCGVGGAHTLTRQPDNTWLVTGTTGPQWVS